MYRGLLVGGCAAAVLLASASLPAGSAGTVSGTVHLAGSPPARPGLQTFKHREVCGESVPDDRLLVGPGGGLRYAVVTLVGVRGGKKPERDLTLVLDNRGCRFEPHVQTA